MGRQLFLALLGASLAFLSRAEGSYKCQYCECHYAGGLQATYKVDFLANFADCRTYCYTKHPTTYEPTLRTNCFWEFGPGCLLPCGAGYAPNSTLCPAHLGERECQNTKLPSSAKCAYPVTSADTGCKGCYECDCYYHINGLKTESYPARAATLDPVTQSFCNSHCPANYTAVDGVYCSPNGGPKDCNPGSCGAGCTYESDTCCDGPECRLACRYKQATTCTCQQQRAKPGKCPPSG